MYNTTEEVKDFAAEEHKENKYSKKLKSMKTIDLDYVLETELGQFGWFQLRNLLLVALPIMASTFSSAYVFTAGKIPHRCAVPECGEDKTNSHYAVSWTSHAIPFTGTELASCSRYVVKPGVIGSLDYCPVSLFTNQTTSCEEYVYEKNTSVVYDFDLGCKEFKRTLAGTFNAIGTLLVLPFAGYISDTFGRRVTLVICIFNKAVIGVIKAFSTSYLMYLVLEFLDTTLSGGIFGCAYIFATELVGPKYRVFTSASCSAIFALGEVVLGLVASVIQPWRHLVLLLSFPCLLMVPYYWILTESVRWLLSVQKYEEAKKILDKVVQVNGTKISKKSLDALMTPRIEYPGGNREAGQSLFYQVCRSRVMVRRVSTISFWWITVTFVYYGLSINSTNLSSSMYHNYVMTSAIGIPGFYLSTLILNRIGRKLTLFGGYLLAAASNLIFVALSKEHETSRLLVYLLGKFGISMVFPTVYLFTSELYPTKHRHSLLSFNSMVGRLGSIMAPLTPALAEYWSSVPSVLFASMAVVSALLVMTQPETLGTRLPDTLAEAIAIRPRKVKPLTSPT